VEPLQGFHEVLLNADVGGVPVNLLSATILLFLKNIPEAT
jgi:hypothetical protein